MSVIREIPNDRMAGLKAPEFVCDECIVNRDIEPLENKAFFLAVLGRPGSGKTSFCVSTLTSRKPKVYYKAFNHLWVFMPPASRKSMRCNPFGRLQHVFDDLDYANLTEVFEAIKKQGPQADGSYETNLLLIDDFASSLKDKAIQKLLLDIVVNRRHLHVSIYIMSQVYRAIPLPLRKNLSSVLQVGKIVNKAEWASLQNEVFHLDSDTMAEVMAHAFQAPHDNLLVRLDTGHLYRNLNRLLLE